MENAVGAIVSVVTELVQKHRELLRIAEMKQTVLVEGNIDRLKNVVEQEIAVIRQITDLEQQRLEKGQEIADHLGIPVEALTATRLAEETTSPEHRNRIAVLTSEFQVLMGRLKEINAQNEQLIQQSLQYIDHMIGLITADPDENKLYGARPDHKLAAPGKATFFDTKI
jgi:flagellar biosynthesis/type III secretory pathway chaperone